MQERARALGVAGYVGNRPDGAVEAVLEGENDAIDTLVRWCGRGPAGAQVDHVDVVEEEPRGELGFSVE
jgi:acylphosphatase